MSAGRGGLGLRGRGGGVGARGGVREGCGGTRVGGVGEGCLREGREGLVTPTGGAGLSEGSVGGRW